MCVSPLRPLVNIKVSQRFQLFDALLIRLDDFLIVKQHPALFAHRPAYMRHVVSRMHRRSFMGYERFEPVFGGQDIGTTDFRDGGGVVFTGLFGMAE